MKILKSIMIIHDVIYRTDFSYLAEMFRFLGIFVCEDILVKMDARQLLEKSSSEDYDAFIFVGNREITNQEERLLGCTAEEYASLIGRLSPKTVYFSECLKEYGERLTVSDLFPRPVNKYLNKEQQKQLLVQVIDKVLEQADGENKDDNMAGLLEDLAEIYIQNDLMLHSMNLQYYAKLPSLAAGEAKGAFIQGYKQVRECIIQGISDKVCMYYRYAQLWCAVKANNACDYQNDILYFPLEGLVKDCKDLCKAYDNFTNAKILLGLSYEPSSGCGNEALMAFKDALQEMGEVCFASPVYYWMGKRYESFKKEEEAEICYTNANRKKEKFRNNYKLAVFKRDKKEYDNALKLFDNILDKLELKLKIDFADSLELEYAFKVYTQECFIYYQMGSYVDAIKMGNRAIEIIDRKIENSKFLEVFYEDKKLVYIEILKKRLNPKTVYRLMMESYRNIRNKEKADEYRQKLVDL